MKILEAVDVNWSYVTKCSVCRSKLEVELTDLKRTTGYDPRDGSGWDYCQYTCPVCKSSNHFDSKIIPKHLLMKL